MSEAIRQALLRYEDRQIWSWFYDNGVQNEPGEREVSPGIWSGLGPGLSNGAYRADNSPTQCFHPVNHETQIGLRVRISNRPGTVKFSVRGKLYDRKNKPTERGKIRELTRAAKRRSLEMTRELEAMGYIPQMFGTCTYPGEWREYLMDSLPEREVLRVEWKRLDELKVTLIRAKNELKQGRGHRLALQAVEELYQERRAEVKALLRTAKEHTPDGRRVKAHWNAFIKRFDREFGVTVEHQNLPYCVAVRYAELIRGQYVDVKIRRDPHNKNRWAVYAVRYRMLWWLEFQSRGAPHIHFALFDCRGLDHSAIRTWMGPAWAAVVAGQRNVTRYLDPQLRAEHDRLREMWGKEAGNQLFNGFLHERGLHRGTYDHIRAGTNLELAEKEHWGYVAAEASKAHQKRVPKDFQNVGRWWGMRKYRRAKVEQYSFRASSPEELEKSLIRPLEAALNRLPDYFQSKNRKTGETTERYVRFKPKVRRFMEAVLKGEDYGYITIWGQAPADAAAQSLRGLDRCPAISLPWPQ